MFKRANKELAKQSIVTDAFDPETIDENFAGVSSDESDDSDIEMKVIPNNKKTDSKKRKLADHADSEDDSDSEDQEDDNDDDSNDDSDEQQSDNGKLDSDGEDEDEYETRLTTEKRVEDHTKSKSHLRRLKFIQKNLTKNPAGPEEQQKRQEHQAKLKQKRQEKSRERAKAKRAAKQARAYFKKHPEAAAAKQTSKDGEKKSVETEVKDKITNDDKAANDKKNKTNKETKDVATKNNKSKGDTTVTDNKSKAKKSKKSKK
ncbi:unnamed protein product [Absidia cylindrospora]